VALKQQQEEQARRDEEERRREREEEEVRRLQRQMVQRAILMPFFGPPFQTPQVYQAAHTVSLPSAAHQCQACNSSRQHVRHLLA
ncbi:unnamed protein product, partial [Closterium sp. Naga37s-1]